MRQITREEIESLPNYNLIEQAITFGYYDWDRATKKNSPYVKYKGEEYISVAALHNMVKWSDWKSSSLSNKERYIANSIGDMPIYKLLELNKGRRKNQPALFPEGSGDSITGITKGSSIPLDSIPDSTSLLDYYLENGTIWRDEDGDYLGKSPDGTVVSLGLGRGEVSKYLEAYPYPKDW